MKPNRLQRLLLLGILFVLTEASAQNPGWTVFNISNSGLPSNTVRSIAIDHNGHLWTGGYHSGGLAKFDGATWTVYTLANSGLPDDTIWSIAFDNSGAVWLATNRGLVRFDGARWTVYNQSNSGLPHDALRSVAVDANNTKWIGTLQEGLAKFNDATWTVYNSENSPLPFDTVQDIVIDNLGNKWLATPMGLAKFDDASWMVYNYYNGLPDSRVSSVALDQQGNKWIGTQSGITKLDGTNWMTYDTSNSALPSNDVLAVAAATNGDIWVGTYNSGVAKFDGTNWTVFQITNSTLPSDWINAITADQNGNIWIGTSSINDDHQGGLAVYGTVLPPAPAAPTLVRPANEATGVATTISFTWQKSVGATSYHLQISTAASFATTVIDVDNVPGQADVLGEIQYLASGLPGNTTYYWRVRTSNTAGTSGWSSVWSFTTRVYASGNWQVYDDSNSGLLSANIESIAAAGESDLWVGTSFGLARFDGTSWTAYLSSNSGLPYDEITALAVDGQNHLWAGTYRLGVTSQGALAKFDGANWTVYSTTNSGLPDIYVNDIGVDGSDNIWIATPNGLAKFDGLSWNVYNISNSPLPNDAVNAITIDPANNKWLGTASGLARFNDTDWTVYSNSEMGLPDNIYSSIKSVAIDLNDEMWIGTSGSGLVRFDGVSWTVYTNSNSGLPDTWIPSIVVDGFGNKWIATGDGAAKFDGANWTAFTMSNSPLPYPTVYKIAIDDLGIKWMGTATGLVAYDDESTPRSSALVSPVSGATHISIHPTIHWNVASGASSYRLQISRDASFTDITLDQSGIADTLLAITGLDYATPYYWRVRAKNAGGTGPWSFAWSFTTFALPDSPQPVVPINAAQRVSKTVRLSWDAVFDASSYSLQVSTTSDFAALLVDEGNLSSISFQVNGLGDSTTYYWRASATNEAGTSNWSSTYRFKTAYPGWTVFDKLNSNLRDNRITSLLAEPSGILWAGSAHGGLATFDGVSWAVSDSLNSGLPSNFVRALAVDALGNKWIGTWGNGIVKFDGQQWGAFDNTNSYLPSNFVSTVVVEDNVVVWMGTTNGAVRFNGITWNVHQVSNSGIPANEVNAIAIDEAGNKWLGTENGLARFDGFDWTVYNVSNSQLPSNSVRAIVTDNGNKWIATTAGLAKFDDTSWTVYTNANSGLPANEVSALAIDTADRQWIGTNGGGFVLFDDTSWRVYDTTNSDLPADAINCIVIDQDGGKWIATSGGLALFDPLMPPPETPTLFFPPDAEASLSTFLTLSWNPSENAQSYRLQIAMDATFSTIIYDAAIGSTWQDVELSPLTTYYWRVTASNSDAASEWSTAWTFVTGSSSFNLLYDSGAPGDGLYQPFPNANWILANRLTAPSKDVIITSLSYYYLGDHANGDGSLVPVVYASSVAQGGIPGTSPLYAGASLSPARVGWNEVDLTATNVSLATTSSTEFFVGVRYNGNTEPMIGYTPISNGRGWQYDASLGEWVSLDAATGFPATLFIRARVDFLTGVEVIDNNVPNEYFLTPNYPNPFNPSTTVQYGLPKAQEVVVKVFNITGQEMTTLVDARQDAGTYTLTWNGKSSSGQVVATGVYFLRIQAGSFVQTRKLLLLQ